MVVVSVVVLLLVLPFFSLTLEAFTRKHGVGEGGKSPIYTFAFLDFSFFPGSLFHCLGFLVDIYTLFPGIFPLAVHRCFRVAYPREAKGLVQSLELDDWSRWFQMGELKQRAHSSFSENACVLTTSPSVSKKSNRVYPTCHRLNLGTNLQIHVTKISSYRGKQH